MKHTGGQWSRDGQFIRAVEESEETVRDVRIARMLGDQLSGAERHANACLIAAAPELLAACLEVLQTLNTYTTEPIPAGVYNRVARILGDTIRKAEGGGE